MSKKSKKRKKTSKLRATNSSKRARVRVPYRQYGVIPIRLSPTAGLEVLLLTSRGTGRWVIPKGWPIRNKTPAETAAREAFEEAGLKGRLWARRPFGAYRYRKEDEALPSDILVRVFILAVDEQKKAWPERPQRNTEWFALNRAARLVHEPGLARLMLRVPNLLLKQMKAAAR